MCVTDVAKQWETIFGDISTVHKTKIEPVDLECLRTSVNMLFDALAVRDSKSELEAIYSMKSWKLIEKYRYFMDHTSIGKVLSKIRDVILNKRIRKL